MGAGHTHSHGDEPHGGARSGLAWDVLDAIVAACVCALVMMLGDLAYRAWRERRDGVRYDLTPSGEAAVRGETNPHSGVTVDTTQLETD